MAVPPAADENGDDNYGLSPFTLGVEHRVPAAFMYISFYDDVMQCNSDEILNFVCSECL
jgi:hypothetical protein